MKLLIEPLCQKNTRWARKKLGTSNVTISGYGCYLVCLSMLLKYYDHEQDPGVLNELFKSNEVYDKGNLIRGWAVNRVYNDIKYDEHYECPDIPCNLGKIDAYLEKRMPVIAMIDFSPIAGVQSHFVLIIGKENDSYLINDPWTGETYFFEAKYGDPALNIYGLRLYSGEVKEVEDDADKIKDLETQNQALSHQLEESSATIGILQGEVEKANAENGRLSTEVFVARNERRQAIWEKEKFEGENKKLTDKVSTQGDSIRALKLALKACKSDAMKNMGGFELIIKGIVKMIGR